MTDRRSFLALAASFVAGAGTPHVITKDGIVAPLAAAEVVDLPAWFVSASADDGLTWSSPVRLFDETADDSTYDMPMVSRMTNGQLITIWPGH